ATIMAPAGSSTDAFSPLPPMSMASVISRAAARGRRVEDLVAAGRWPVELARLPAADPFPAAFDLGLGVDAGVIAISSSWQTGVWRGTARLPTMPETGSRWRDGAGRRRRSPTPSRGPTPRGGR